jgi:sodium/potassium/calcium exchanger 6
MRKDASTMNDRFLLEKVQQWRRPRYSARPFALTILAITLMSLLAWAKGHHALGDHVTAAAVSRKRDLTILDEEVCSGIGAS